MIKARYKGQFDVFIVEFLGADVGLVRCVCINSDGVIVLASHNELVVDMDAFMGKPAKEGVKK